MRWSFLRCLWVGMLGWAAVAAWGQPAGDPKPIVGPGASRDDVLNTYGWPSGQAQAGTREILTYPQGQVTLENGRVERVDFNMRIPWPAPRPRPGGPAASTASKPEDLAAFWLTDFTAAAQEAARRNARVLVLFTGSDWSPASKRFTDEVAFHPDFVNAFTGDYVFLLVDLPSRTPQLAAQKEQNNRLRERYGVTTYPALVVVTPAGRAVGAVDLMKERAGSTYRERAIAAVREVRDELAARPPAPDPMPVAPAPGATVAVAGGAAGAPGTGSGPAAGGPGGEAGMAGVSTSLLSAQYLVMAAIGGGGLASLLFIWWLWRGFAAGRVAPRNTEIQTKIDAAASGLPGPMEIIAWPREKLVAVTAGLVESDGFRAAALAAGGDYDLVLRRGDAAQPAALVACVPGAAGTAGAKRVRELFAAMTAEGVPAGWIVAPAGFAGDAANVAAAHGITLVDTGKLLALLRDLPPLLLAKALGAGR